MPALASTTSVPAFCTRVLSASMRSSGRSYLGTALEKRGTMVEPEWPPTTGTSTPSISNPTSRARNVLARTTSSVDTPNSFRGS